MGDTPSEQEPTAPASVCCVMETREQDGWTKAMQAGDFERAWQLSDRAMRGRSRPAKHTGPRHLQAIWRGEELRDARVLVRCYHGLGDTIQYIRFAETLRKLAREVTVWVQPQLLAVVGRAAGVDKALPLHDGMVEVPFDVDIEIMELPHALRASAGSVGRHVPYLFAKPANMPTDETGGLRIGLVWQAGDWDAQRSMRLADLAPLLALGSVKFFSLHPSAEPGSHIVDASSPSIAALAERIATLDLVVTVDTMTAHLAGALGRPVWTFLHASCDWRWGLAPSTPWYPSMRLFRQRTLGDWRAPVAEAAAALCSLAHVRTRT